MSDEGQSSSTEENTVDIEYACFMVDERPHCLWDIDVSSMTLRFLEGVDPEYFEYAGNAHFSAATEEKNLLASLALRTTYSQALETLFAFIAAALQAPECVPAWITTYRTSDLRSVVEKVQRKPWESLPIVLKKGNISWQDVSEFIHLCLVLEDKDKEKGIKKDFADLWSRFASDFLDENANDEYNSIKHGLRVRVGGFQIAAGIEDVPGIVAPKKKMRLLGKSEYGSSYLVKEKLLGKSYHMRLRMHHRNWDPEDFLWGLHLISISIQNIVSALKVLNGVPAEDVSFHSLTEEESLSEPWKRSAKMGLKSMAGFQRIIPEELIKPFTKDEIKSKYLNGERLSGIRYTFTDGSSIETKESY